MNVYYGTVRLFACVPKQHPAGNELYLLATYSLPDACNIESQDSLPLMAHQHVLAPV